MTGVRLLPLALGVLAVAFVVGTTPAADKAAKKGNLKGVGDQLARLLPDGTEDKLKLTDDQKKQLAKVEEEFKDKSKEPVTKFKDELSKQQEALKKARQDKDKAAMKDALTSLREPLLAARKVREEYREKVKTSLTDEQKKTFEESVSSETIPGQLGKLLGKKKKNK